MSFYEILSWICGGVIFLMVVCFIITIIEIRRAPLGQEIPGVGFVPDEKP